MKTKRLPLFLSLTCVSILAGATATTLTALPPIETETAYAETTIPLENGTLLNSCDEKAKYWLNSNNFDAGGVTLDLTIKTEGTASTRVVANKNNYVTVSLRHYGQTGNPVLTEEELLAYDNLYLEVYNTESSDINLFMYNCLATTLSPGWNSVVIPNTTTKAQIDESQAAYEKAGNKGVRQYVDGQFYFAVYADCTLLFDNVRGVNDEDLDNSDAGGESTQEFSCEYAAVSTNEYAFVKYGSTSVTKQTSAEAATSVVPTGYTDNVLTVSSDNQDGKGVLLDFSALKIPTKAIETLTVRLYYPDDTTSTSRPNIRIYRTDGMDDWAVNYSGKALAGQWFDFTLNADGTNFNDAHNFSHLSKDGYLDKFELAVRTGNTAPFYIDSVSYTLSAVDIDVPVISYKGDSTVYWLAKEDAPFTLNASATDKTQGNIDLTYVWSDSNAVNANGSLNVGNYTLTLKATDAAGNEATLTLTVIAVAPETTAPVIHLPTDKVTLVVGTKPKLYPQITDNSGAPTTRTTSWSHGALDKTGKLTVGTHTYTITATDLSGNTTTKTVTVTVTPTETWDAVEDGAKHEYGNNWFINTENHWKECSCGEKTELGAHMDTDNDEKCDTCAYPLPKDEGGENEPTTPPEGGENEPTTPPEGGDNEPTTPPEGGENEPTNPDDGSEDNGGNETPNPDDNGNGNESANESDEGCNSSAYVWTVGIALALCAVIKGKKENE